MYYGASSVLRAEVEASAAAGSSSSTGVAIDLPPYSLPLLGVVSSACHEASDGVALPNSHVGLPPDLHT